MASWKGSQQTKDKMKENREWSISINWSVQDVMDIAEGQGIGFTIKESIHVLKQAEKNYDANYGITWDTIENAVSDFLVERPF